MLLLPQTPWLNLILEGSFSSSPISSYPSAQYACSLSCLFVVILVLHTASSDKLGLSMRTPPQPEGVISSKTLTRPTMINHLTLCSRAIHTKVGEERKRDSWIALALSARRPFTSTCKKTFRFLAGSAFPGWGNRQKRRAVTPLWSCCSPGQLARTAD